MKAKVSSAASVVYSPNHDVQAGGFGFERVRPRDDLFRFLVNPQTTIYKGYPVYQVTLDR